MIPGRDRLCSGILILADESAEWRCAGLRQIDRLLLGLNEHAGRVPGHDAVPVCIYWDQLGSTSHVADNRLPHLRLIDHPDEFCAQIAKDNGSIVLVSTHLVIARPTSSSDLDNLLRTAPVCIVPAQDFIAQLSSGSLTSLRQQLRDVEASAWQRHLSDAGPREWIYLDSVEAIPACERRLLHGTGKSQDGFVARFVNRPISRTFSRILLRTSLLPNQCTLLLLLVPLAGGLFLLRGDYFGFLLGAILFQVHSALDGCDGEIARLKYLESATGSKLDEVCDRVATLTYAVALVIGLSRQPGSSVPSQWFYLIEGIIAALLIGVGESLLTRVPITQMSQTTTAESNRYPDYVRRHAPSFNPGDHLKLWIINHSKILFLGEWATALFSQLTKRDVFNLGFMLLALCGRPAWILHILAAVAGVILVFGLKSLFVTRLSGARVVRATD